MISLVVFLGFAVFFYANEYAPSFTGTGSNASDSAGEVNPDSADISAAESTADNSSSGKLDQDAGITASRTDTGDNGSEEAADEEKVKLYDVLGEAKSEWKVQDDGSVIYKGDRYKRKSYVKAILAIGVDRHDDMTDKTGFYDSGNADAVFLLAHDTSDNRIKVLMIPRDTICEVNIMNEDGQYTGYELDHVSQAFGNGDGYHGSCKNMADAVSRMLMKLKIDHYAAGDLALIGAAVDAVGGVSVTIPNDGLDIIDSSWTKGSKIVLTSENAEKYLRYRDTAVDNSAVFRMSQHVEFILGFMESLKNASKVNPSIITDLYDMSEQNIVTDMQKPEILKLAADELTAGGFNENDFYYLPGVAVAGGEYDEVYLSYENLFPVLLELFYRKV